ncbi:MAG: DUF2066 domain-containing protein [Gammaproteobacteria bacterium]|nr:DUF2066 domain-containing protein [Gammaproteobacteria bacterium]
MNKINFRWLLAWCVLCISANLPAMEVTGLYEAEVPVVGQDLTVRQDAMRAALAEVLVKVSGNRAVATLPGVAELVNSAPQYVQQFVYRNATPPPGQRSSQPPARMLWVRFDRDALIRVLRTSGVAIWGNARPSVMLWLDVYEQNERAVVGIDNKPEWKQFIENVAKMRGVPLILPKLDADDLANIQTVDPWNAAPEDVKRISARYRAEAVLVGRIEARGNAWASNWAFYDQENRQAWTTPGDTRDAVVLDGLQAAIDELAGHYNTSSSAAAEAGLALQVNDVQTLEEYARVTKYLGSLASVARLQLLRVEGLSLIFRVEAQGGAQRLTSDIRLGTTLAPLPADASAGADAPVRFRLVR